MATNFGPNIKQDNLILGFDTGYGVADNETKTRFYTGEPTTNEFYGSGSDGNILDYASGYGGYGTAQTGALDAFGTTENTVYRNTGKIRLGPTGGQDIGTLTNGNTYTFSVYLRHVPGQTRGTSMEFDIVDKADSRSYSGSLGGNMTYDWKRFSVTALHNNNSNYHFIDVGTYQGTNVWEWCMPQIETGSRATPYCTTSRSNTQCLIDLAKTKDLSLANVSFDTTGQPTFDGSDDYIELGDALNSIGPAASFEFVFKATETVDHYRVLLGWGHGSNNYSGIHIGTWTSSYTDESFHATFNSSTTHIYVRKGHGYYKDNAFHHAIVTAGENNYAIWIDGVDETDTVVGGTNAFQEIVGYNSNITAQVGKRPYGGGTGWFKGYIPVMKVYDKILTNEEIKQNFKAYKNRFNI